MKRSRLLVPPGIGLMMLVLACARAAAPVEGSTTATAAQSGGQQVIVHLVPRPDSVGSVPEKFEWSAVPNAQSYSIGVWNEVDRMIYRQNGLTTNSMQWPKDSPLDMGTYFWSVTALNRDERPIGDSGLAAFVVNK